MLEIKNRILLHVVDIKCREKLSKEMGLKIKETPTTGMMAIYELLMMEISELYITGFTFYKLFKNNKKEPFYYREYYKQLKPDIRMYRGPGRGGKKGKSPSKQHPPHIEFNFFKKIYKKENRIKCDKFLTDLVKDKRVK